MKKLKSTKAKSREDQLTELLEKNAQVSERVFGEICGVDHEVVRKLRQRDIIGPPQGCRAWNQKYIAYLEGVAAGRRGSGY